LGLYSRPDPVLSTTLVAAVYRYALSNPGRFVDSMGLQALPLPTPPPPASPPPLIQPVPPPACQPSPVIALGRLGAAAAVILNELFNPASLGGPGLDDFTDTSCKPKCGNCDPAEHGFLQAGVNDSCKGRSSRCSTGMTPQELESRFWQNVQCNFARQEINNRCFNGGNAGHREAADNARRAALRCLDLLTAPTAGPR
jgi:hypothetical protein